jgi:hypothetical protein
VLEFAKKVSDADGKQTCWKKRCLKLLRTAMTFLLRSWCWLMKKRAAPNHRKRNKTRCFSAGGVARGCAERPQAEKARGKKRKGVSQLNVRLTVN